MKTMKTTITKRDIARRVARQVDVKLPFNRKSSTVLFTILREVIAEADPEVRIEICGFGVFEVKTIKAKPIARNPRTGEIVYVPPKKKNSFQTGEITYGEVKKPL